MSSARNYALDKLKMLGLADLSGNTNAFLDSMKESDESILKNSIPPNVNDEETQARLMDMAMSVPAMGSTRAVRELGALRGKAENALAGAIKDVSPESEHIRNLKLIRESKLNPADIIPENKGAFKEGAQYGNKFIKKFKNEEVGNDLYPMATREQLAFDKMGSLNPNTKTYAAGDSIYQVQKPVTPYEKLAKTEAEFMDRESILKQMLDDRGIPSSDLYNPTNHGEIGDELKVIDAGGLYSQYNLEDVLNLPKNFKTSKQNQSKLIEQLVDLRNKLPKKD